MTSENKPIEPAPETTQESTDRKSRAKPKKKRAPVVNTDNIEVLNPFRPAIDKLDQDLRGATRVMNRDEVRLLVSRYYDMQENRKRSGNQLGAAETNKQPGVVLAWLHKQDRKLEKHVSDLLDIYSASHPVGRRMRSYRGIAHILSAGLLAHIDITRTPTAGHVLNFAGLVDKVVWVGRNADNVVNEVVGKSAKMVSQEQLIQIANNVRACPKWLARRVFSITNSRSYMFNNHGRMTDEEYVQTVLRGMDISKASVILSLKKCPWNQDLKKLCWNIGQCFKRVRKESKSFYRDYYLDYKSREITRNDRGDFAEQAASKLRRFNIGQNTDAYRYYSRGFLPPAHLDARATRAATKLFLGHVHEMMYVEHFGKKPPVPYAIAHLDHAHYIEIPPPEKEFETPDDLLPPTTDEVDHGDE